MQTNTGHNTHLNDRLTLILFNFTGIHQLAHVSDEKSNSSLMTVKYDITIKTTKITSQIYHKISTDNLSTLKESRHDASVTLVPNDDRSTTTRPVRPPPEYLLPQSLRQLRLPLGQDQSHGQPI